MSQLKKQFSCNCNHYNYKVILLGDYGVGKTSLFHRIKNVRSSSKQQLQRLDSRLASAVYQDTIDYCSRAFTLQNGKTVQVGPGSMKCWSREPDLPRVLKNKSYLARLFLWRACKPYGLAIYIYISGRSGDETMQTP